MGVVTIEELQRVRGRDKDELEGDPKRDDEEGIGRYPRKMDRSDIFFQCRFVGFFEFTFMRTNESLPMKRLAELMQTYQNTPEFIQEFFSPGTSRGRTYVYRCQSSQSEKRDSSI